jgi:glutaredoxin
MPGGAIARHTARQATAVSATDMKGTITAMPRVVLYTRSGCHLCDDAQRLLEAHGLVPECIDVDRDPRLREQFGDYVPVVEIDGRVCFRGRVDPVLLRRVLKQ